VPQCGESAIVIETTSLMGPQTLEGCGPVAPVGSAIRLKIVDADFRRRMHIPTRVGENRRHVTRCAFRFTLEYRFSVLDYRGRVMRVRRRGYRELIKMQSGEFWSDQIRIIAYVSKSGPRRYRELSCVIQTRIVERTLSVHFQVGDEGIPVRHRAPTGPRVKVHACEAERRRNQRAGGLPVVAKSFSSHESSPPHFPHSPPRDPP